VAKARIVVLMVVLDVRVMDGSPRMCRLVTVRSSASGLNAP
jgi:hypothetical protein